MNSSEKNKNINALQKGSRLLQGVFLQLPKGSIAGPEPKSAMENYRMEVGAVKSIQTRISTYVSKMFASGNLTEAQSEKTADLLFISDNINRIAERCSDIDNTLEMVRAEGNELSPAAVQEMAECFDILDKIFGEAIHEVSEGNTSELEIITKGKRKISKAQKQFKKAHLKRVKAKECPAQLTDYYAAMLYNMDRMADSCASIAESAQDHMCFEDLRPEDAENMVEQVTGEHK